MRRYPPPSLRTSTAKSPNTWPTSCTARSSSRSETALGAPEAWAKRDPSILQNGGRVSPAEHHTHWEGPGRAADIFSGFSTLANPLLSASNDISILKTGKDLFENDCSSTGDKILAGADLLTLGLTKGTKAAYFVAREKLVKLGNLEKLEKFDDFYTSKFGKGWYTYEYTMYGKNLIWDFGNKFTTSVGSIMTAFFF